MARLGGDSRSGLHWGGGTSALVVLGGFTVLISFPTALWGGSLLAFLGSVGLLITAIKLRRIETIEKCRVIWPKIGRALLEEACTQDAERLGEPIEDSLIVRIQAWERMVVNGLKRYPEIKKEFLAPVAVPFGCSHRDGVVFVLQGKLQRIDGFFGSTGGSHGS